MAVSVGRAMVAVALVAAGAAGCAATGSAREPTPLESATATSGVPGVECVGFSVSLSPSEPGVATAEEAVAAWIETHNAQADTPAPAEGWTPAGDGVGAQAFENGQSRLSVIQVSDAEDAGWVVDSGEICQ